MSRILKTSSLAAAVFIGLSAGASSAQDRVDAKIPFSFVVRSEQFPAGRYEFTTSQGLVAIRGRDNDRGMFVITNPADGRDPTGDEPVLVFRHYENTYRLSEIWNSETRGSSLLTSRDRQSANRATSNTDPIVISLAANAGK